MRNHPIHIQYLNLQLYIISQNIKEKVRGW